MGRFKPSERGGGEPDPQEALRRSRDAVARERAERGEEHPASDDQEEEIERVGEALREHDERLARDEDRHREG